MRQFTSIKQYERWVIDRYEPYVNKMPESEKSRLMGLEASNHGREYRSKEYDILDRCFSDMDFPKIEDDTIVWRACRSDEMREYVSCSVFKGVAEGYGDPVRIILKEGSPVLPLRALHHYCGASQGELIIETKRLCKDADSDGYYYK